MIVRLIKKRNVAQRKIKNPLDKYKLYYEYIDEPPKCTKKKQKNAQ
jgi:hypothetical protein